MPKTGAALAARPRHAPRLIVRWGEITPRIFCCMYAGTQWPNRPSCHRDRNSTAASFAVGAPARRVATCDARPDVCPASRTEYLKGTSHIQTPSRYGVTQEILTLTYQNMTGCADFLCEQPLCGLPAYPTSRLVSLRILNVRGALKVVPGQYCATELSEHVQNL
jgi:hypothetical protein